MSERLMKPYEISVWEDRLTNGVFEEIKLAVIGSDTMTGLNKVYNPVFNKKSNGEKTLSFSLRYKYFDPYIGNEDVVNPFAALLINERKVKLKYGKDTDGKDQWYEFIIKDHSESSDGLEWTYSCTDAFVLELSKTGYNITFDSELNNNQGTAEELATKTLETTDWRVGDSDTFTQLVAEPIYKATIHNLNSIEIVDASDGSEKTYDGTDIYLFYSYVKNQNGKFVQFIERSDSKEYVIDDNNVITDTNYRIKNELIYDNNAFYLVEEDGQGTRTQALIIQILTYTEGEETIKEIETKYQANRLAYNQLTTYDPVMQRTVDRFIYSTDDEQTEIYKYTDYDYTTSNVVTNYITNGENLNVLEDGSLQGWNPYTDQSGEGDTPYTVNPLELVTYPELNAGSAMADLNVLSQVQGYLKVLFNGAGGFTNQKLLNSIYNSGIENNASSIHSISKGDKFVFRWRAGSGNLDNLEAVKSLGLVVARYTADETTRFGYYYKHIKQSDVIIHFTPEDNPKSINNIIGGGTLSGDSKQYIINSVVQTPSSKYLYEVVENDTKKYYYYNGLTGIFEENNNNQYLPYYYLVATANQSVPNTILQQSTTKIGIFIYSNEVNITLNEENQREITPIYIQDIQLSRYIPTINENNEEVPILIGNVPTATSNAKDYFYVKPSDGAAAEDIETYADIEGLAARLGVNASDITPLYNENSEKTLTISASQSNCFNILQTIAETFECWVDLQVEHDDKGYIQTDEVGPRKFIYLREYAGKDNYAGFKYGINLESIERNVNSDEIVTKLIVDQSQSEYVDEGYISIQNAPSNPSGESYILNFDYYYNQGLLNKDEVEVEKNKFITEVAEINKELKSLNTDKINLESALTEVGAKRNLYTELITTATDNLNDALERFETGTGLSYEAYRDINSGIWPEQEESEEEIDESLLDEDTIADIIGQLYANSATINNYSGILSNIDKEYWNYRHKLRGSETHTITFWSAEDATNIRHIIVDVSDYLSGLIIKIGSDNSWDEYKVTLSQKYFDITSDAAQIQFTLPSEDYIWDRVDGSQPINIGENKTILTIKSVVEDEGVQNKIQEVQEQKDSLVKNFNNKYSRFIQEGTWNSTDYIDSELYYLDALQVSNTSAQPTVSYTINVVEVSQLEGLELYSFNAGDKTYVEDTEFFGWSQVNIGTEEQPQYVLTPAREEVIVSEVEWHLDSPEENIITVQNYKTRFEDLFQRISAAVQTVQYNEATYAKISSLMDADGTINQNVLLQSLNRISGQNYNLTSDGSVVINGDNILVQNLTNSANRVIINSEGIRISSDGGQTWRTAIDGQGINIGTVYTGTLNTNNVVIGSDDNPSFRWDKSGISAYKSNAETGVYDLKTYVRYDEYGLYGIKNNGTFKAQSLEDVKDKAHFAVTWDGFFIKNSYEGGGRVEITSDNDFRVLNVVNNQESEKIKIGALEWIDASGATTTNPTEGIGAPTLYGIRIKNNDGTEVFKTGDDGNIEITGIINATGGNFSGIVNVGPTNQDHIIIDGRNVNYNPSIHSSNYQDGTSYGWMINKDGDAVFNNITARGAIKTAVFEYAEIQAVGGIFIFRPSSTIRSAAVDGNNLILTVEKPILFKAGQWCKISNYASGNNTTDGEATNPDETNILLNNGLTHVYEVARVQGSNNIILLNGAEMVVGNDAIIESVDELVGGALVDMGNKNGTSNYGIGVNSSDNTVNLPARAISLFETTVDETKEPKVTYNYRGILGTLPVMSSGVDASIYQNMQGTQGIYTDNMYIGDNSQYIAFYTDKNNNNKKKLKIQANQIMFEVVDETTGEIDWRDVSDVTQGADGEDAIYVMSDSTAGNFFQSHQLDTYLIAHVYRGSTEITNQVTSFNWYRRLPNGQRDTSWSTQETSNLLQLTTADVDERAVFVCEVTIA